MTINSHHSMFPTDGHDCQNSNLRSFELILNIQLSVQVRTGVTICHLVPLSLLAILHIQINSSFISTSKQLESNVILVAEVEDTL